MENTYTSDFDVRLATLAKLGGDADKNKYASVYDIDLEILKLTGQGGGGGITPEEVKTIVEEYNYTTMAAVEAKKYMQQKKLTLNGDATAIVDEDGNALTYTQIKALVDNKALFVYMLVDNAFYIPCGDMVVPSGHNAVEFSSAFIVSGEASIARIIIDTENEVLYEQYWLADKEWIRQQGYLADTQLKTINGESIVGEGDIKVGDVKVIDTKNKFPYIECTAGKATIYLVLNGGIASPQFEYSYDKSNWMPFNSNVRIDMQVGETIYLKGSSDTLSTSANSYVSFGCDTTLETYPSFTIGGDFDMLLDSTAYSKNYCYYGLFIGSNQSGGVITQYMGDYITKIANMSVTASEHGCDNMFAYSDIASVDNLSLRVESGSQSYQFNNMFNYCKKLTHAHISCTSSINSNKHAFAYMFSGCGYLQTLYFGAKYASAGNFDSVISDGGYYVDVKERIIYTDVSSSDITIPSQWTKIDTKYFGAGLRYAEATYAKKSEVPASDDVYTKDEFVNIEYGIEVMSDGNDKPSIYIAADMAGTIQMLDVETDEYVYWSAYDAKRAQNAVMSLALTQAEYDALEWKDPQTLYIITDAE